MQVEDSRLSGVRVLRPRRVADLRGYKQNSWSASQMAGLGIARGFIAEYQMVSRREGTLFGLTYQAPPLGQDKLVRVVAGEITQVAVDARKGSISYGHWTSAVLSAENGRQMLIPEGFLQGYITHRPDTAVLCKVTAPRVPEAEHCIHYADPALAIDWGVRRDRILPDPRSVGSMGFAQWESPFIWAEQAA